MHSPPLPDEQTNPNKTVPLPDAQRNTKRLETVKRRQITALTRRRPALVMIVGMLIALCVFLLYARPISGESSSHVVNGRVLSVDMPTKMRSVGMTPAVSPTSLSTRGPMQIAVGTTATPPIGPTPVPNPSPTSTPNPPATATPTLMPTPTPTSTMGVNGNPWGYDFVPGNRIYTTPSDFCRYFACIGNFEDGKGYVVECSDGQYSKLGGKHGTCSHHGHVVQALYSHEGGNGQRQHTMGP